jgi:uncharacterized protein (DUF1810 family)
VNLIENRLVEEIFGYPDHLKFKSSITLFARAATRNEVFMAALARFFDGKPDHRTLRLL